MLRNTTLPLPEDLVARTQAYAAARGTTVTALIRAHLDGLTRREDDGEDPIMADFGEDGHPATTMPPRRGAGASSIGC